MEHPTESSLGDDGTACVAVVGEIDFTNADEVAQALRDAVTDWSPPELRVDLRAATGAPEPVGPAGEVSHPTPHQVPANTASSRTAEVTIRTRHRGAVGGGSSQSSGSAASVSSAA